MHAPRDYPLDLGRRAYTYVERPNPAILALFDEHVLSRTKAPRVLDVGCGAGANARALRARAKGAHLFGIEPNPRAAELARAVCDGVFEGFLQNWIASAEPTKFDAVVMSDVLEHIADPFDFLRALVKAAPLSDATFIVSVPNYAVWYNRARTLFGRFDYAWSGLYDRTHLRFFTRHSIRELLERAGLEIVDDACSPSIVQSAAPVLRKLFERDVAEGEHLSMSESKAFRAYRTVVEPVESAVCRAWPELLGFQIVVVARVRR